MKVFITSIFSILILNFSNAQSINQEISLKGEQPFLIGKIDKKGLTTTNYNSWFSKQYDSYTSNKDVIKKFSKALKEYEILVFMGTWCGDSKREVPRFIKILEDSNYPMKKLTTIGVSRKANMYKQSSGHEERGLNIHRVPIFIFYKNGVEVNRIVESPVVSLEQDILDITQSKYQSKYHLVTIVNEIINEVDFSDQASKLIPKYKMLTNNMYELNTYSKILATTERIDKSIEVLELNTKLFPENPAVYVSLGNACLQANRKNQALVNYEKALKLNPTNANLKNRITSLKSGLASSNN